MNELQALEHFIQTKLPTLLKNSADDSVTNTFYPIFHPTITNRIKDLNSIPVNCALIRYKNPAKIDLLPYFVKYYYCVFHAKKTSNHLNNDVPSNAPRKGRHSRNISFADIITIKSDDAKCINQRCQYFKTLNKSTVFNLDQMFEKPASSPRRCSFRSVDVVPSLMTDLRGSKKMKTTLHPEKRSVTFTPGFASIGSNKRQRSLKPITDENRIDNRGQGKISSLLVLPNVPETKPEIVKRVIQKLETEEFTFKPQSKRRPALASKMKNSLQPRHILSNDIENRPARDIGKVRLFFQLASSIVCEYYQSCSIHINHIYRGRI